MAYAYWKSGKMNDTAVFDLYFRKNPFNGEFTVFAGLEESIKFLHNFHFSDSGKIYWTSLSQFQSDHYITNIFPLQWKCAVYVDKLTSQNPTSGEISTLLTQKSGNS